MKKNFEKFINIETDKIQYIAKNILYDVDNPNSKVVSGDWDIKNIVPIQDYIIYKSLNDMFVNGKLWRDTDLYKFILNPIVNKKNKYMWGCSSIELLDKRGEHLHNLYENIKKNGILKHELVKNEKEIDDDEIMIGFDRNGAPIAISQGNHRLAIAKILKIKTVPVKVYVRHTEWENTRREILDFCNNTWGGKSYHPIPHPDFDDVSSIWSGNKYNFFKENTSLSSGTILDLGSLFGYYAYKSELNGYSCTACETDKRYLNIMKKLHTAYSMKYNIIDSSLLDLPHSEYDIVFAFNIFHHFLKNRVAYDRLVALLGRLKYKEMYIQFHQIEERQMIDAYRNYNEEEFVNFIIKNSIEKNSYKCLGEENGRKIYKIY